MRVLFSLALLGTLGTVAGAQASATKTTPRATTDSAKVGAYDLELTTDIGTTTGELTIKRASDKVTASLMVSGHSPETKSFAREGGGYVLLVGGHDFTVTYKLSFARDSVYGTFAMVGGQGLSGMVNGALRR